MKAADRIAQAYQAACINPGVDTPLTNRLGSRGSALPFPTYMSDMCGRYPLHASPELLEQAFGVECSQIVRKRGAPCFNIAPTQSVPIVRNRIKQELTILRSGATEGKRELVVARWSSIPEWAKDLEIG